jgi:hypothetical protein
MRSVKTTLLPQPAGPVIIVGLPSGTDAFSCCGFKTISLRTFIGGLYRSILVASS